MKAASRWQGLATVGATVALALSAAALTPGAAGAASLHSCGNKNFYVTPQGSTTRLKLSVANVAVQGVSCQTAFKFVESLYLGKTSSYHCTIAKFKVPAGKVPEVCTRHGAKIQFAGEGG
jgi:hypothetical protein